MNRELMAKALDKAEAVFVASTKVQPLTSAGKPYKNPPKTYYLIKLPDGLVLTHRIPDKPKVKSYTEKYKPLCTVHDYSKDGLDGKNWDLNHRNKEIFGAYGAGAYRPHSGCRVNRVNDLGHGRNPIFGILEVKIVIAILALAAIVDERDVVEAIQIVNVKVQLQTPDRQDVPTLDDIGRR